MFLSLQNVHRLEINHVIPVFRILDIDVSN